MIKTNYKKIKNSIKTGVTACVKASSACMKSRNKIRMNTSKRIALWVAILIMGMILACLGDSFVCSFAYLYPTGLGYAFLGNRCGVVVGLLSYAIYIGLLAGFLLSKQLRTFSVLCIIMVLICLLTSYGCQKMTSDMSENWRRSQGPSSVAPPP